MAGLPCRFAGNVRRPLILAPASIPPNVFGSGPSAAKATSGLVAVITKSTPPLDGVEDARHRLVELGSSTFELDAGLGAVVPGTELHRHADLGGEHRRHTPASAPRADGSGRRSSRPPRQHPCGGVRCRPRRSAVMPRSAISVVGCLLDELPHDGGHHRGAPVGYDGDPLATELVEVAPEPGFPAIDPRQREGLAGVAPVADVEPPGRVANRSGQAAVGDGHGAEPGTGCESECGRRSPSVRRDR